MMVGISELIRNVFSDGEIHTLEEAYLAVLARMKAAEVEVSDGTVRHRVRSRVHGLHKSGAIKRVGPAAYILNKDG